MFLVLIAVIATSFMALLGSITSQNLVERDLVAAQTLQSDIEVIGAAVDRYYLQKNLYPTSLTALAATPGYENLNQFANLPNIYGYRMARAISDGTNTFDRAAVFALNTKIGETSAAYVAGPNTCGSGSFDTGDSWCGPITSPWLRFESRTVRIDQKTQLYALIPKLYRKIQMAYPNSPTTTYPPMNPAMDSIANLVGYAGTAASCSGNFRLWAGVELDCSDLFSVWGTPMMINQVSPNTIQIGASPPP